jgi:hypothetical protein
LTSVGNVNPTYDNNGNLKYDTFHNLTWDAEGNMLNVDSTAVQVTYDAFNRAVEQNRSGSFTQIVYAPYGGKLALMNGTTLVKAFVSLPGGPTAVYAAGTTGPIYYRHPRILEHEGQGAQARQIFTEGNALLDVIVEKKLITARGVYGLFPANAVGDDVELR